MFIVRAADYFAHYGTPRKSGRYPWGTGKDRKVYNGDFLDIITGMKRQGISDVDIAKGFGLTTTELRAERSIRVNERKQEKSQQIDKLASKGMSPSAIGKQMGINESSVRSVLAARDKAEKETIFTISSMLKDNLDAKGGYLQIGAGVENNLGISGTRLNNAVAILKRDGYVVKTVQENQLGTQNKTLVKVLAPPGSTYREINSNRDKIRDIQDYSEDGGKTFQKIKPPLNIDPKRIKVRYAEEGGTDADGVLYVRPGVPDVTLGGKNYAQVRVAVGGTHYMKGMAVYKDDLPKGVDIEFNTNKSSTGNKLDALKKMQTLPDGKVDQDNPFGALVSRQVLDTKGEKPTSVMNILREEGNWGDWNKSIASQVLSKQSPELAKQQLAMTYEKRRRDLDEIKSLTNPEVRRHLLDAYAKSADSAAVHLKAAALPRQATQVILPLKSIKPNEIYAPNFRDGETVALVRYPHGGKFEIPELTVNNRNREGKTLLGKQPLDAVGIHTKVAERLSGADFDGDTVVVFPNSPNNPRRIQSEPALQQLKDFDAKKKYAPYDGMKTINGGVYNAKEKKVEFPPGKNPNSKATGLEMGKVSNLITDMTIMGASHDELARAVKHSMVVIDAEKHNLDNKRSYQELAIGSLYKKYQKSGGGASTLISRATSPQEINKQRPRRASEGGPIDPKTGKLMTVDDTFIDRDGNVRTKRDKVDKLAATDDAYTLVSKPGTKIEAVYADHSNSLKALANEARREIAAFKPPKSNPSAKVAYKDEVASLVSKINVARGNKPRERQAQIFANAVVNQQLEANPNMDPSQIKKLRSRALEEARNRTNALKQKIVPTPQEWAAIQAGATSQSQLKQILENADLDAIRELATPRTKPTLTGTQSTRARAMAKQGYTQSEIADQLGVSTTALRSIIEE